MNPIAVAPSIGHESAFLAMLTDFEAHDPENAEFYAAAKGHFPSYVRSLIDEEAGIHLKEGWVPCTHRWLMAPSGNLVGVTRLRHNIDTLFLAGHGGHIGYDVAPGHRRKGYGHLALRIALKEASALGLSRLLLFAAEDNLASRAVIERQGGELDSISFSEFYNERLCRYWINRSLS
jgi:predicted acetyltransferase